MDDERETKIRERAHQIWEREGQPSGREAVHWAQAVEEIAAEGAAADAAAGKLKVTPYNDPTRPGGPIEGGAYPGAKPAVDLEPQRKARRG